MTAPAGARAIGARPLNSGHPAAVFVDDESARAYPGITYVIPCGGAKLGHPAPARELYTGSMFRHTLANAERCAAADEAAGLGPARVFVLSARYGLVELGEVLQPYDLRMEQPGSVSVATLAAQALALGIDWGAQVYALLPRPYLARLDAALRTLDVYVQDVYEATRGNGEQKRVNVHIGRPASPPTVPHVPGLTVWLGGDVHAFWWGTPLLVSYGRLRAAKTLPAATAPWVCDSRGFSEIAQHGTWTISAEQYAADLTRYAHEIGHLVWAAPQDWPCNRPLLTKTGLTEIEHQRRTIASVRRLRELAPTVPIICVVTGLTTAGYLRHVELYRAAGIDLRAEQLVVGVGALVGRPPAEAADIIRTLYAAGLHRLHGFGVKLSTPFLLVRCPVCSLVTSLLNGRWRVCLAQRDLPIPEDARPWVAEFGIDLDGWLDGRGIADGAPFLLSPSFEYDVELNSFFRSWQITSMRRASQVAYARDLARFLTFLSLARGGRGWRDATEDDHLAFHAWRRRDPAGPAVAGSTWDREVASVNRFFAWAVERALVVETPVPQRARRLAPAESGRWEGGTTPATYSHDAAAERVQWLPPAEYRRWRDVGLRGYGPNGLPDPRFRGRWAGRNAAFADFMVRTGLRLTEQASLLRPEVPIGAGQGAYRRFWLPAAIAKGGSARWVYVPDSMARELGIYVAVDRAEAVDTGRRAGLYDRIRRPLVIEDAARPVAVAFDGQGSRRVVKLAALEPAERRRVLVAGDDGLEPAALWISEYGTPVAPSTWKSVFADANARCRAVSVALRVHPHMLRHSFAVVTLEQLQRGHLAALAGQTAEQRGHYTRVFGDPLDWVRRRLGHRSLTSTMIYLHALAELEMHTRMALVPDGWEDPHPQVLAAAGAS